jgi:hypothetical protein
MPKPKNGFPDEIRNKNNGDASIQKICAHNNERVRWLELRLIVPCNLIRSVT